MAGILTGTVALVTGASSGIGEATAAALAAEGAAVAVVARRRDRLEALSAKITAAGGQALVIEADVTDDDAARAAIATTVAKLGRLDTLVNNAGLMLLGGIVDADAAEWKRMMDLNVSALMTCAHAALPHLLKAAEDSPRKVADMINISSVAGRVARSGAGVYNATKFAVGAFSEALRQEVTKRHVRVALVEPGFVDTELQSHNKPEVLAGLSSRLGGVEAISADQLADAIVYIVTRRRNVAINEMLIRPTEQEG